MQASATIAASLNPFASTPALGAGTSPGLEGMLEGLFGGGEDGAQEQGVTDAFAEALAAAMSVPTPVVQIQSSAAKIEGASAPSDVTSAPVQTFMLPVPMPADTAMGVAALPEAGIAAPDNSALASADAPTEQAVSDLKLAFASVSEPVVQQIAPARTQKAAPPTPLANQPLANQPMAAPTALSQAASTEAPAAATPEAAAILTAVQTEVPTGVQAQAAARTPLAPSTPAEPSAKAAGKGKATIASAEARGEHHKAAASPGGAEPNALAAEPADAPATHSEGAARDFAPLSDTALTDTSPAAPAQQAPTVHDARTPLPAANDLPRATPHTVAHLAAQIMNKLDGKSTRFDVQLDPHGLGKVDVKVEINASGAVSAALTFENPQAAAELRGRQGELQAALEQAGFDLSKTSLSFSSGGQGQQGLFDQQQQHAQAPVWRGRAFTDLSDTPETAPSPIQRRATTGVDVRI